MSNFHRDYLPHFRPSGTNKFMNCNLWLSLPFIDKTEQQIEYLQERTNDHERLYNGQYLDNERAGREFCKSLEERCKGKVFREVKLGIKIGGILFSGTPDYFCWDEERKELSIVDFKTGFKKVSSLNNPQLKSYALLILKNHPEWEVKDCILTIWNTQTDTLSQSLESKKNILKFGEQLGVIASKYKNGYTFSNGIGDWCQFCDSKQYCPLRRGNNKLKDLMDEEVDKIIYESRKRALEIKTREQLLKTGKEFSSLLSPLIKETTLQVWNCKDSDIPDKFWVKKKMTIAEARKQFPSECGQYLNKTKRLTLCINKLQDD